MPISPNGIKLGTAMWNGCGGGDSERRALVALLPGDHGRVVDLNRVERARLSKLGEGRPDALANALVPSSLRLLLESGPRAIQRAAQALSYADKWHRKGGLPEELAPYLDTIRLLPCLPRPLAIRNSQGQLMDRLRVKGPGATVQAMSEPTVAIIGPTEENYAGHCLAASSPDGPLLGAWLCVGMLGKEDILVEIGEKKIKASTGAWEGLIPPRLLPSEVFLLPPPILRLPHVSPPDGKIAIESSFERMEIYCRHESVHMVIQ